MLFRLCLFTPLLLLLGLFAVLALCIESSALVPQQEPFNAASVSRVKQILRQHKVQRLRGRDTQTIAMSEEELNLLASHLAHRLDAAGAVLKIQQGLLAFKSSWDISALLPYKLQASSYLNIDTVVASSAGTDNAGTGLNSLHIQSLRIGQLSVPPLLVETLVHFALQRLQADEDLHNVAKAIQTIDFGAQEIALTYQWREDLIATLRGRFITAQERQALAIYQQFLVAEVDRQGRELTFTRLLEATFRFARERSHSAEPVLENKAAIIVLAAYANGGGLSTLLPEARNWPKPRRAKLRLHGRSDLAQHFMTSAALAVAGGGALSNAIGLRKEMDDAHSGSGFSFKDLAADMAGTRFGELAVASSASASTLQNRLAKGHGDTVLMAGIGGLEENLSQAKFAARYGGPGDRRYQQVVNSIDQRINSLALHRLD
ncbi:MAG: hypothetical protein KBT88_10895 [Gammaproteobacteria bacterium]|nr:hypothetical protein [Gammaproteobacteria bacterium]MBQ0840283.1 hypothetical protein [Gammaproteobacteria bacterium]